MTECTTATRADESDILALFEKAPPRVAGRSSKRAYSALLAELLRRDDAVILLARRNGLAVGYVAAVADWVDFKRAYVARHPVAALGAALRALARRRSSPAQTRVVDMPEIANDVRDPSAPSWRDREPGLAKVVYVGVAPEARGQGVGRLLARALVDELRVRGFNRVDAHITSDNVASLRMHEAAGWTVRPDTTGFIAFAHTCRREPSHA